MEYNNTMIIRRNIMTKAKLYTTKEKSGLDDMGWRSGAIFIILCDHHLQVVAGVS